MTDKPTLMAVDGNSLLHRAYHALSGTGLRDDTGRPTWAVKGMWSLLCSAAMRVRADAIVIGFDDSTRSMRRERNPDYKGTRIEKASELVSQLALCPDTLRAAGLAVCVVDGLEADDVTATAAVRGSEAGWHTVIVTSDKDAFGHISDTTSVLRILNGGVDASPMLTPGRLEIMIGIDPSQYLDYAALRGDASDNLPGVYGIGEKTARKLLSGFGTMEALWADRDAAGERIVALAGRAALHKLSTDVAYDAWARSRSMMSAVTSFDLGLDLAGRTGPGMLPLPEAPLRSALAEVSLTSVLGPALSALTGFSAGSPTSQISAKSASATAAPPAATPPPPAPALATLF